MSASPLRIAALLGALVLAGFALAQIARALNEPPALRAAQPAFGPMLVNGQAVRLHERPGPRTDAAFVDLQVGDRRLPGTVPVWRDPAASRDDYAARYGGRFLWYAPRAPDLSTHLIELDFDAAGADRVRWRTIEIAPDGRIGLHHQDGTADQARAALRGMTLGLAPVDRFLVPAPAMLLCALLALLVALPHRPPAAWPTLALVAAAAGLASLVAWPFMLELGLRRALPAPVLALGAAMLGAGGLGPRAQAACAGASRVRALALGVVSALLLTGVFIAVQVSVNGFVAPVFRAPGGALSPGEWFVNDYLAPTLALTSIGLPLAVPLGACYGLLCGRPRSRG